MVNFPDQPSTQLVVVDQNNNQVINIGPGPNITVTSLDGISQRLRITADTTGVAMYFERPVGTLQAIMGLGFDGVDDALKMVNAQGSELGLNSHGIYFKNGATSRRISQDMAGFLRVGNPDNQVWTPLATQNGWTTRAGFYPLAYRQRPDGTIELRGALAGGNSASGTIIATMPIVSFRPTSAVLIPIVCAPGANGANAPALQVNPSGTMQIFDCVGATTLSVGNASWTVPSSE